MNSSESTGPAKNICAVGDVQIGGGQLVLIAGPCVIEDEALTMEIAKRLHDVCNSLSVPLVFKASFDKANRTSAGSYRGVGIGQGLEILANVRRQFSIPVTTDIHEPGQAAVVAEVCELVQIPAFLARQTDLLLAAGRTGKAVNVKKGQFMAPADMRFVVEKLRNVNCENILLTERGTFFGYGRLVNDFAGLVAMQRLGVPVVFDATHSVQQPGGDSGITGGNRQMVAPLARAAVATGVDAIFLETHPDPDASPSDAANMFPMQDIEILLRRLLAIDQAARGPALPLQSTANHSE